MDSAPLVAERVDGCFHPMLFQLMPICEAITSDGLEIMLTGIGGDEWLFGHWSSILDDARKGRILLAVRDFLNMEKQIANRRTLFRMLFSEATSRWRRRAAPEWLHPSRTPIASSMLKRAYPRFPFARNQQLRMLSISHNGAQSLPQEQLAASLGVEMRSPFMDIDLVHFSFTLPGRCLTRGRQNKRLLRDAISSLLPTEILEQPMKTYFDSLSEDWLPTEPDEVSEWDLVRRRLIRVEFDEVQQKRINLQEREFARLVVAETTARRYNQANGSKQNASKSAQRAG
jgi:asparagine synthase (glutamine-hydrolysing)